MAERLLRPNALAIKVARLVRTRRQPCFFFLSFCSPWQQIAHVCIVLDGARHSKRRRAPGEQENEQPRQLVSRRKAGRAFDGRRLAGRSPHWCGGRARCPPKRRDFASSTFRSSLTTGNSRDYSLPNEPGHTCEDQKAGHARPHKHNQGTKAIFSPLLVGSCLTGLIQRPGNEWSDECCNAS